MFTHSLLPNRFRIFVFAALLGGVLIKPLQARLAIAETEWINLELRSEAFLSWLSIYYSGEDLFDVRLADTVSDPDGDGNDNYFEFLAKLDPTDRDIRFRISFLNEPVPSLQIEPIKAGVIYRIQLSENLNEWADIDSGMYQQIGDKFVLDLPTQTSGLFYRVLISD